MQIVINVPDSFPAELLKQRVQEIEKNLSREAKTASPQPNITQGDKTIDINALFGIWQKQPKALMDIRKQAWQRAGLDE